MNSHKFKYNHIYKSSAGKLWMYKGSTCSSAGTSNRFCLTFRRIGVKPDKIYHYTEIYRSFNMFNCDEECNTWKLDKMATIMYSEKDKEYFKNQEPNKEL